MGPEVVTTPSSTLTEPEPEPQPEPEQAPTPSPPTSPTLRRSSRASRPPDRLQPGWGTKTYAEAVFHTDPSSIAVRDHLHRSDPRGGGGIDESRRDKHSVCI